MHDAYADVATEASVDGDVPYRRGTAGAALRNRDFDIFWGGTFLSNIGTWMQNVLLGAFAYELTGSSTFVGIVFFAQLGPLLFLSTVGGVLADIVDRRKLLVITQLIQLFLSIVLAGLAASDQPSEVALVVCVFAIGIANALAAPSMGAILPRIVPREDLPGAVSLQSVQMNLHRVIGPAIGAPIYTHTGAAPVFLINAATYLFAVLAVLIAHYANRAPGEIEETGMARLLSGFRLAWNDLLIRRILITLVVFSFFSLTFVGLMPAIAAENLAIRPKSTEYGVLYAVFGLGAAVGAITIGTVFAGRSKANIPRWAMVAFAVLLTGFALVARQHTGVPDRVRARVRLLPRDHVDVDGAAGAPRGLHARSDHGAVDDGVRRHGAARRARRRLPRQHDERDGGADRGRGGRVRAVVLRALRARPAGGPACVASAATTGSARGHSACSSGATST